MDNDINDNICILAFFSTIIATFLIKLHSLNIIAPLSFIYAKTVKGKYNYENVNLGVLYIIIFLIIICKLGSIIKMFTPWLSQPFYIFMSSPLGKKKEERKLTLYT